MIFFSLALDNFTSLSLATLLPGRKSAVKVEQSSASSAVTFSSRLLVILHGVRLPSSWKVRKLNFLLMILESLIDLFTTRESCVLSPAPKCVTLESLLHFACEKIWASRPLESAAAMIIVFETRACPSSFSLL